MSRLTSAALLGLIAASLLAPAVRAQAPAAAPAKGAPASTGNQDFRAQQQIDKALEYLAQKDEEHGTKLLSEVPRMFPTSSRRFDAYMALGKYFEEKHSYGLAVKQFNQVLDTENEALLAESLYETGKCYFMMNQYNQSFAALRKVTTSFPNSVFANQSFYYIGMCHFAQNNWKKAIDNLRMVGTAVTQAQDKEDTRRCEAGQRFYVKVFDKNLVVLAGEGKEVQVDVTTSRGDHEVMKLAQLDKKGEYFIGSLPTKPGAILHRPKGVAAPVAPKPAPVDPKAAPADPKAAPTAPAAPAAPAGPQYTDENGVLEIAGGDTITTEYINPNSADGRHDVHLKYDTKVVSTATSTITDGAFKSPVQGVFLGQPFFVKVMDLDKDASDKPDKVMVKLTVSYVAKKDQGDEALKTGVDISAETIEVRDQIELELVETDIDSPDLPPAAHTGVFTGRFELTAMDASTTPNLEDKILHAKVNDSMKATYRDELHIDGDEPVDRNYEVKILAAATPDVSPLQYTVPELELKAKKSLLEARALKELADIFKGVGLKQKSTDRAKEGLAKVDSVILNRQKIGRDYVEQAMRVKWELFMVMDDLQAAINTCHDLMVFAPESSLVDQALMQIGKANVEKGKFDQAIRIFQAILSMQKSDEKPLAAFSIGEAYEKMAEATSQQAQLTSAMKAYQDCADKYPNSLYAGQSLEKVANFYLKMQDYRRAEELLKSVVTEFPDLDIMSKILLKLAIAQYRLNELNDAHDTLQRLVSEYPESSDAEKAQQYIPVIEGRMKGAAGGAAGGDAAAPKAAPKAAAGAGTGDAG